MMRKRHVLQLCRLYNAMIKKLFAVAGLGVVGFAVYKYFLANDSEANKTGFVNAVQNSATYLGDVTMGFFKVSNARLASREMLGNQNVQAFLAVIRKGEGTSDANGYRRLFGGQLFASFADHPRITVRRGGISSTAAGAYQFLASTWDETRKIQGLADFTPANQDLAALGRIAARGALDDVMAGRFEMAVRKCAKEWASLPFSPYGQPVQTFEGAKTVYLENNGIITA